MTDLDYIHPDLRSMALAIDSLTPDPKNARKHSRRNLDAIKASLSRFGMRSPIVVQRQGDQMIVRAGNGRMTVAKELGWTHLPATVFDEGDDDAMAYAIADNRTADLADWDYDVLSETLSELQSSGFAVEPLGFDIGELEALTSSNLWSDADEQTLKAKTEEINEAEASKKLKVTFQGEKVRELNRIYDQRRLDGEDMLDFILRELTRAT